MYERMRDYENAVKNVCGTAMATIIRTAWDRLQIGPDDLVVAGACLYLNSEILKVRLACPNRPYPDHPEFTEWYNVYSQDVARSSRMKQVFAKDAKDHFLGLMIHEDIPKDIIPVVLSIQRTNQAGLQQFDHSMKLALPLVDMTRGELSLDVIRKSGDWFRLHNLNVLDANIYKIIGPPIQFVLRNSLPPAPPRADYFYPGNYPDTTNWGSRAAHYLYIPEKLIYPLSSGCTILLVERDGGQTSKRLVTKIMKDFIPEVRTGISWAISSVVSRLEHELIIRESRARSVGGRIRYPVSYACQEPNRPPRMPLLEVLDTVSANASVLHLPERQTRHVLEAMRYLTTAHEALTTGYSAIVEPLYNCLQKLWFSWCVPEPSDIDVAVQDWNSQFIATVGNPDANLQDIGHDLLQVVSLALGVEPELAEIPRYREHFIHSFHVFALGLCLLRPLIERGKLTVNDDVPHLVMMWYFTALCHDLAYCVEKLEELSNRYVMALQRRPRDYHTIPVSPAFGHLLVFDGYFDNLLDKNEDCFTPDLLRQFVADTTDDDLNSLKRECRRMLIGSAHHGVLGAAVFLESGRCLDTTHSMSLDDLGRIALSVMLHHVADTKWFDDNKWIDEKKRVERERILAPWRKKPWDNERVLASMLMICDTVAQWGRNFEYASSKQCLLEDVSYDDVRHRLDVVVNYPRDDWKSVRDECGEWYQPGFAHLNGTLSRYELHKRKDNEVTDVFEERLSADVPKDSLLTLKVTAGDPAEPAAAAWIQMT